MRFLAIFQGRIEPQAQPEHLTKGHFDWLRDNSDRIADFGGLRPAEGGGFIGAAWIINAETEQEARALIHGDPYSVAGLWFSIELYLWNRPGSALPHASQSKEKHT